MGLGGVTINIANGALGSAPLSESGITAMVLTGDAIAGKLEIDTPKDFFSIEEVEALGITNVSNGFAYKQIKAFYDMAGSGAELWIMLVDSAVKQSEMVDLSKPYLAKIQESAKGRIRLGGVSQEITDAPTVGDGVNSDALEAVSLAQALIDSFTVNYNHMHIVLDGANFNGNPSDLTDLKPKLANRVSVFISNIHNSRNSDIGLLLGRLASDPVQRHPARVKTGRVSETAYFGLDTSPESVEPAFEAIANKGYVFLRGYSGKAGYFFSDAPTCTTLTDDFVQIPNGRVIDKAVRLAYQTYVDEIKDEIPVSATGGISPALIKAWESQISKVLDVSMLSNGEISGHKVFIDTEQDILGTGKTIIVLKIQPIGYASEIIVNLGFTKTL